MSTAATCRAAIGSLYREHHGWLHGWLRRRLNCNQQAADLAQDTFLRLLAKDEMVDLREPRAYLTTIAHGLVVNHWRRKALEQAYLEELASRPEAFAPSPEERALAIEALVEIARVLDGLPPRVREIFLLSQIEGLTYSAIGSQLGVSVNVVQKAMIRAMAHCYKALYPA